jgi:capsular polysaccharide biosynthesis protein
VNAKHLQALGLCLLILGIAILGVGGYFLALPEQYKATARVSIDDSPAQAQQQPGDSHDHYFIQTDFEAIQSEPVLDAVIENYGLNERWGKQYLGNGSLKTADSRRLLKQKLSLAAEPKTNVVLISVTSQDPVEAAKLANAIADQFRLYKDEGQRKQTQRQFKDLDDKIEAASRSGDNSLTNLNEIERLKKFRDVLALGNTQCRVDRMVEIPGHATPPPRPASPIPPIGKALIVLGIFSEIGGLVLLNGARQRRLAPEGQ